MKTIASNLTVTNTFDDRGKAIKALIETYIPAFHVYYGFKNLGAATEKISFPALFIDPDTPSDSHPPVGETTIERTYDILFFVIDNNPEDVVTLATSGMEALFKLFSNNALSDYSGAHTQKFMTNSPHWSYSEIRMARISKSFLNAGPVDKENRLMRVGQLKFWTQDITMK